MTKTSDPTSSKLSGWEQIHSSRLIDFAVWLIRCLLGGFRGESLIRRLGLTRLRSFYYFALRYLYYFALWSLKENQSHGRMVPATAYYEFGVGLGYTLINYVEALKAFCKDTGESFYNYHIFLFDSFEGLPEKEDFRDDHPIYGKGSFAHDISEIKNLLINAGVDLNRETVHFVKGYYEETLKPSTQERFKKHCPRIVTVDVDYYSSTKTVLDWLEPLLSSGTIFYFDDIWSFHGNPDYGELAAINEFNRSERGFLTPCHILSDGYLSDSCYIYSRKRLEYGKGTTT
jgi:hypothetical protein